MAGLCSILGRAGALAAAAFVAAVGGAATVPAGKPWAANPEEQFLLDVKLHQYRLGDGVRAYNTPEGTCLLFGDFIAALDVPIKVDLVAKKATGWAFAEKNRIAIDLAAGRASFAEHSEALETNAIRQTPEGWCVDTGALSRWFGLKVKPMTSGSVVMLETSAKLPVEMAIEREKRAANLHKAAFDLSSLPQVRLPYRMWRAPALDFVVSAGMTYRADTGVRVDRRASILAAGEFARLSYEAQVASDQKGRPSSLRLRAYRSDPDGQLLGPLKATHFGFGDVSGLSSRLSGSSTSGRGLVVSNRPVITPTSFDRTRFEGELPAGWEAELYRNGQLLAFARSDDRQRYVFDDVQLLYGENDISIVLYGPQGQVRTRNELVNVGQDNVPPGKTWYWAGANQPGRDLVALHPGQPSPTELKLQAAVAIEHGLDQRTSVGMLARTMLLEDQRVTFVEGSVRRSVGSALVEVGVSRETSGGTAARAQLLGRFGSVNVSADAVAAQDFHLRGGPPTTVRDVGVSLDAPIRIGRAVIPAHGSVRYTKRPDGSGQLDAAARLAAAVHGFNLATDVRYSRQQLASGPAPPPTVTADLIATGRIGRVRVRGSTSFQAGSANRFRSAELTGYWSASDRVDWEGTLAFDGPQNRARARISHIRRMAGFAVALTGEAATDGAVAFGINLNFSLDPTHGFSLSRRPLAGAGSVRARVYRDVNGNGSRDPGEPFEKGALVTAGTQIAEQPTGGDGSVLIPGLATFKPITVGIDRTSLSDPMLAPSRALQVVVPRPGIPARVDIALVASGDIEGALVKNGGLGFEGVDLELVNSSGAVVSTARTDYDGYFLFERVPYGSYAVRIAQASADALGISSRIDVPATITQDRPVERLGSIHLDPKPRIASAD